ncbi:MAG: alanine--tRNA ligase [Acidobacteriota bacterium]|jgi:alanyl-tRNA synthetase
MSEKTDKQMRMPALTSAEVRSKFLDYFAERGHTVVPSSSLIPRDDPTLLFTNAGMNQFKEVFLGHDSRSYVRAASSQKCMRVSGKHNDLENVGPSSYHHTFFEMLGNFSFGDYFKEKAIEMGWELLTEGYGLPAERLWASVYEEDDEAFDLWKKVVGLPDHRILRLGKKDNYWSMGDTGPCGPCSEIHFDYGVGDYEWPSSGSYREPDDVDLDADRFVELWNLVFMQFNADGSGQVTPLPAPNIDTGAGLERMTAVVQGVRSNYDTDLFRPLIDPVAEAAGCGYGDSDEGDVALRVIADHCRATAFLLADGVGPANEGRGYVLRRLIRRAVRFGMKLGFDDPFFYSAAQQVVRRMGGVYPELIQAEELIERVTRSEEERFFRALGAGTRVFEEVVEEVKQGGGDTIPGDEAFRLYDTYGLPLELTREFGEDVGLTVDEAGFRRAMEGQRERARAAWKGGGEAAAAQELVTELADQGIESTTFVGYTELERQGSRVLGLLHEGHSVEVLEGGRSGALVVDVTPFYSESGGQVGDRGKLESAGARGRVTDTHRLPGGLVVHRIELEEGELRLDDEVRLTVDAARRAHTVRNHTATHLLHAALRERLGEHVRQAGSLVAPDRLRFDFSHFAPVDAAQLAQLERDVNDAIRADIATVIREMPYDEAIDKGALAFFGDKYGDIVRVVSIPGVSTELCGGTHVARTGEIGTFVITREESVAAGTRRIEAITGASAIDALQRQRDVLHGVLAELQASEEDVEEQVEKLLQRAKAAERENEDLKVKLASRAATDAGDDAIVQVDGIGVLCREVDGLDAGGLRNLADSMKAKLGSGVVVLGTASGGKAQLIVGVTHDVAERIKAGDIVRQLAAIVGGGGGGKAEMAQAGGPDAARLGEALAKAPEVVAGLLG